MVMSAPRSVDAQGQLDNRQTAGAVSFEQGYPWHELALPLLACRPSSTAAESTAGICVECFGKCPVNEDGYLTM